MSTIAKSITNDPLDVVGVIVDTGGPYQTTSPTFETLATSESKLFLPVGTYLIITTGSLLNTTNNAEGDFRVVAEGAEIVSSRFGYESGTQDIPKTFTLQTIMRIIDQPRPPGSLTELQGLTNAGTLTVSNLIVTYLMLAKRDVTVLADLTPPP